MSGENLTPLVCAICGRSFDSWREFKEHSCFKGIGG